MHISDMSMLRMPQLAQRGSTARLGMDKAMPAKVLGRAQWATPVATARTIQNRTPKQEWSFPLVLVSPGPHCNTAKHR